MRPNRINAVATIAILATFSLGAAARTAGAQALPAAKDLMEKNDALIGGRAALDKHTSFHQIGSMSVPSMGMQASFELFKSKPMKYLQKIVLGALGEIQNGYDGTTAWAIQPGQPPMLLDSALAEGMKLQADFYGNLHDQARYKSIETIALVEFEGAKCYKVKVVKITGAEGYEFYDSNTGLIAGIQATTETPMGKVDNTSIFSDYKEFDGIRMPTKITQKNGQYDAVITFTSIEWDNVDPSVFALPDAVKAKVKP